MVYRVVGYAGNGNGRTGSQKLAGVRATCRVVVFVEGMSKNLKFSEKGAAKEERQQTTRGAWILESLWRASFES